MPYFITDEHPDCPAWAVVKEDGELLACHANEDDAIAQMVAVSISEEMEPGGTYEGDTFKPRPEGRDLTDMVADLEALEEARQVDLTPPAYMRAAARQGLRYYEEGLAGDGLVDRTVTEARQMARGDALTADKWVRIAAWIARHMGDLDAPAADPENEDYPSAGVVAHLLWGSGPSKRAAARAQAYAEGVVARLERENDGRAKGEALKKLETRTNLTNLEVRELDDGGMRFEGYAAVFNSPSEPLPFIERIAPGAFARSLRSRNDVKMLWNHDAGEILASTRAGTMQLTEDDRGLKVMADIAPTTRGKDLKVLLSRGDIDSMSIGFSVIRDSWNEDGSERTLHSVRLAEVSVVAWPAYTGTSGTTSIRGLEKIARSVAVDADELADALLKVEGGQKIDEAEKDMLQKVLTELGPEVVEEQPAEPETNLDALALKKAKLKLLEL